MSGTRGARRRPQGRGTLARPGAAPSLLVVLLATLPMTHLACGDRKGAAGGRGAGERGGPAAIETVPAEAGGKGAGDEGREGEEAAPGGGKVAARSRVEGKGAPPGEEPPVVVEAVLDKTRLTIGEVLTITLTVDRAAGVEIRLPEFKRYGRLEVLGVTEIESPGGPGRVVLARTYRLQGFVVGAYRLPGIPVRYTDPQGRWRQTRTDRFHVWVASVIPAGTDPEDILGLKDLFPFIWKLVGWALKLAAATAAVLVVAGIGTWLVFRRRRRARWAAGPKLAHDLALEEIERLLAEGLVARGLLGRHYTVLHMIFRRYLERRFHLACMERTSEEILVGLQKMRYFGQHTYEVADRFFEGADLVKFASYAPQTDEIDETLKGVYYFIELTRERSAPPAGVEGAGGQAGGAADPPAVGATTQ